VIVIVGLDGATWELAGPLMEAGDMPALARLVSVGASGVLRSTTPPVTFPAWSSFMTGANPGKHGIFDFSRRLPGSYEIAFVSSRDRRLPTIWRVLSNAGRRVAVLGVPTTYPPEPVNGVMVGGFDSPVATGIDGSFVHPRSFYDEMRAAVGPYTITDFQELRIGPAWHDAALPKILAAIERKRDLARWVLGRERWDVLMVLFGEADTASHHFWMFADPRSPRFVPERAARHAGALRAVYRRLDAALGQIVAALPASATVLVASDHGFGGAGTTVLHLNRWLAEEGFLRFRTGPGALGARAVRRARRLALLGLPRGIQERIVRRGGRQLARRLEGWSRFAAVDMARSVAFSEELNYAPSIWLNVRGRDPSGTVAPGRDYDALVERLRTRLLAWRHPATGAAVVRAVHRRDELYDGPYVGHAPDLVLELALEGDYSYVCLPSSGAERASVRSLGPDEYVAGKGGGMNGSHRPEGLWALAGPRVQPGVRARAAITDVAPTVLHLAGLPVPSWMDGCLLAGVPGPVAVDRHAGNVDPQAPAEDGAAEGELWRRLASLGYLDEGRP
jgi:predicted AlkP superfamily phosphohydrolase/phosphomutase